VGELSAPDIKYSKFQKDQREVGQLSIGESAPGYEEVYEGGCIISHGPKDALQPDKHPRIWANFKPRTKDSKETRDDTKDKWTTIINEEDSPQFKDREVGKLKFSPDDYLDENFEGEFPWRKIDEAVDENTEDGTAVQALDKSSPADLSSITHDSESQKEEKPMQDEEHPAENDNGGGDDDDDDVDDDLSKGTSESDSPADPRRRKMILLLLLLPLLIAGAIFGVVLGKKKSEENARVISSVAVGGAALPHSTIQPSTFPSANPSRFSSSGSSQVFRPLSSTPPPVLNANPSHFNSLGSFTRPPASTPPPAPTVDLSLVPIIDLSTFPTATPLGQSSALSSETPSESPSQLQSVPTGITSLIIRTTNEPSVEPTSPPIGTMTPTTYTPTLLPTRPPSVQPSQSPTPSPSNRPTPLPSRPPSVKPSQSPTNLPSNHPVTLTPTAQPAIFLGGCPAPFVPIANYDTGMQVQSQGIVYQCTGVQSCGYDPGSSSGLWKEEGWQMIGSCSGTSAPTLAPTRQPSEQPSRFPSKAPSIAPTEKPSNSPSSGPSELPTKLPSNSPSKQPITSPSKSPSELPTKTPSKSPSREPTTSPSELSSSEPTASPSKTPSRGPTSAPSEAPYGQPTASPSKMPSQFPTSAPSKAPSDQPTASPSKRPSQYPTSAPSKAPSDQPTQFPTLEPSLDPTSNPTPEPSLEPTSNPTLEPSLEPTPNPTPEPTFEPTLEPTSKPTQQPTTKPTFQPTRLTEAPTLKPTCPGEGNFNLCIAIDMSGSVCNGSTSSLCLDCAPTTSCNSGGEKLTICCPNFSNMLEFTKDVITELGELPTDQDFSIVHFGSDVTVASSLDSWKQSIKSINKLKYTGGKTNLAGAISSCQLTLDQSPPDRKNLMLIITDGAPSVPAVNAGGAATTAALNAKLQDTFIIPVLIEEPNSLYGQEVSFLTNNISSDGKVFVSDFDGLNSLQDSLFEQITCQANGNDSDRGEGI